MNLFLEIRGDATKNHKCGSTSYARALTYYNRFINFFSVKREQVAFLGMEKSGKGFFIKNLQGSNLQFCPQMLRTKVQNI